ncbi:M1 family metallopeptidase [Candidatus Gracilibacteria bacterium]|nr:M1 family metallopeptidase [Candidatus Gracilibacteria bacterium]
MKKERVFKYYPEDFGDLTVKVLHMDLSFDVFDDHTVVDSEIRMEALEDISELELNAKNLEILEVSGEYQYEDDILKVHFDEVKKGAEFSIKTKSICRPTRNILEGIYYDETPKGCPCQQITQCQQWGFQRIVPCIDDMTAKCTYSTEIIANEKYTNMISNGDVSVKVESVGEGRAKIKYENNVTPMATYLFFLGVGSYSTFEREFIYPGGDKFMLELLVPPGSDEKIAHEALDVLHDAIMWVYLFTGPNKYENAEKSLKIKELMEKGSYDEAGKMEEGATWGYKYTGTVYREIGMQNSDFGGMENVGNTTITTNRIMPFNEMTDGSFEYMIRVKAHEYYHNLNGSEVTGRSPFEIWLNEAVTVFIEQEYHSFLFGKDYARLDEVLGFLAPGGGTFAADDNVASMPIEPDGFNDPNELITGVTYVKAPEFVRMIETLMGKELFVKGLDLYHRRYAHGNASRAQWVEAMEEASKMDFGHMAQAWLKQRSYPKIHVSSTYEDRKLTVKLRQEGFTEGLHWEFPFVMALVSESGEDIAEVMYHVDEAEEEIVFEDVDEPAFLSLNREYKTFAKVFHETTEDQLYLQFEKDSDVVNRHMAFAKLAEMQKMKVLEGGEVDERFVKRYFAVLKDEELMASVGTGILAIFEQVEDKRFAHAYQDLYDAVKKIKTAIAEHYEGELYHLYEKYDGMKFEGSYTEIAAASIKARGVKNTILSLLAKMDNEKAWKLIKAQFDNADCATDKVVAFSFYINSSAPDKLEVLAEYETESKKSLVSWESFLACVGRNNSEDALDIIRRVEKSESFRIDQANDQRALYCVFAGNRKKSLLTEAGREFLEEKIKELASVNEFSTLHMLKVFGNIDLIDEKYQSDLVQVLRNVEEAVDAEKYPSVANNVKRILEGSPKGVGRWEKK